MFAFTMAALETMLMFVLAWWAGCKVTNHMSILSRDAAKRGRAPTNLWDALAVCAIGCGAAEHALYNICAFFFPTYLTNTYSSLDALLANFLYAGMAYWVIAKMVRDRRQKEEACIEKT